MKHQLRLYVSGKTSQSHRAIKNLKRICNQEFGGNYEVEVIDVLENPQLAEDEKIFATPTLVKLLPPPLRKLVGDMSLRDKVLLGLDIVSTQDDTSPEDSRND